MIKIDSNASPQRFVIGEYSSDLAWHFEIKDANANLICKPIPEIRRGTITHSETRSFGIGHVFGDLFPSSSRCFVWRWVEARRSHASNTFKLREILGSALQLDTDPLNSFVILLRSTK